jgi:dihydroorotase
MPSELLLKGGQIYDGSGEKPYCGDVRIRGGYITEIRPTLATNGATILDVTGLIVAPGLIDFHTHVYDGMNLHSVAPADAGLRTGVTTLLDMGSAGAMNYPTFEKYVMPRAAENIYALLNISHFGVQGHPDIEPYVGDLFEPAYLHPAPALRCFRSFPDRLMGIKVRLTASLAGTRPENEKIAFANALHVSREVGLPCFVHHVASSIPIDEVVAALKPRDVLTHLYHGYGDGGFLSPTGEPHAALREARQRGVLFDVGHGSGAFAWSVAEPACQAHDFWPDIISTDLHRFNILGPVFDLPTTMTKFLHLGMRLESVIRCATGKPAAALGQQDKLGRLLPGRVADITILEEVIGQHALRDSEGVNRIATRRLRPLCVFRNGKQFDCRATEKGPDGSAAQAAYTTGPRGVIAP